MIKHVIMRLLETLMSITTPNHSEVIVLVIVKVKGYKNNHLRKAKPTQFQNIKKLQLKKSLMRPHSVTLCNKTTIFWYRKKTILCTSNNINKILMKLKLIVLVLINEQEPQKGDLAVNKVVN
jgi:hypothetical protein